MNWKLSSAGLGWSARAKIKLLRRCVFMRHRLKWTLWQMVAYFSRASLSSLSIERKVPTRRILLFAWYRTRHSLEDFFIFGLSSFIVVARCNRIKCAHRSRATRKMRRVGERERNAKHWWPKNIQCCHTVTHSRTHAFARIYCYWWKWQFPFPAKSAFPIMVIVITNVCVISIFTSRINARPLFVRSISAKLDLWLNLINGST